MRATQPGPGLHLVRNEDTVEDPMILDGRASTLSPMLVETVQSKAESNNR